MRKDRINKFGGINDYPKCDERIRRLWRDILRRCYDADNHKRKRARTYTNCSVCTEWFRLSQFAKDIQTLENYELWKESNEYCIDKDMMITGNKIYRKEACKFVLKSENSREAIKRHPEISRKGAEKTSQPVALIKGGERLLFESCKKASVYLGLHTNAVSKNSARGYKCRGYEIVRI